MERPGVSGRVPFFLTGVSSRHDSHIGSLIPPPRSNPGPTGGSGKEFFSLGLDSESRPPYFCATASYYLDASKQTPSARVDRGPGRSSLLDAHSKAHR
jgi:hypothetical protein